MNKSTDNEFEYDILSDDELRAIASQTIEKHLLLALSEQQAAEKPNKSQLLTMWAEFGQRVINGAFHRNADLDELAAIATILIEDTEDELA